MVVEGFAEDLGCGLCEGGRDPWGCCTLILTLGIPLEGREWRGQAEEGDGAEPEGFDKGPDEKAVEVEILTASEALDGG